MHVNPAVIRSNPSTYNSGAAQSAQEKTADKAAFPVDKMPVSAQKTAEKEEFSFWDLVDIINPLQHIPVVNTLYREITGDQINNIGRIVGGTIFGGFAGAALGGINALVKNDTGNDLGELAMVKAGFRADRPKDEPIHMVPVIDKAADKLAGKKNDAQDERATLDNIIWDAPSLLQVATKETIKWDQPYSLATKTEPSAPVQTAVKTAVKTAKPVSVPDHVVRDVPQNAYQMAQFDPAALNNLEPGNPESSLPQQPVTASADTPRTVDGKDVPETMMQALSKYQSMQRLGGAQAIAAKDLDVASTSRGTQKFPHLGRSVRRY